MMKLISGTESVVCMMTPKLLLIGVPELNEVDTTILLSRLAALMELVSASLVEGVKLRIHKVFNFKCAGFS